MEEQSHRSVKHANACRKRQVRGRVRPREHQKHSEMCSASRSNVYCVLSAQLYQPGRDLSVQQSYLRRREHLETVSCSICGQPLVLYILLPLYLIPSCISILAWFEPLHLHFFLPFPSLAVTVLSCTCFLQTLFHSYDLRCLPLYSFFPLSLFSGYYRSRFLRVCCLFGSSRKCPQAQAKAWTVGDPEREESKMGALVSREHLEKVRSVQHGRKQAK